MSNETSLCSGQSNGTFGERILQASLDSLPGDPGIAFLGFSCDEGVRRANAQVGQRHAPDKIRQALFPLAYHGLDLPLYDFGNLDCDNGDLEAAQLKLGQAVAHLREKGFFVIVLGGGNETAWGHYQGLQDVERLHLINWGAHFDLFQGEASSKTAFRQIYEHCQANQAQFRYLCLGVQHIRNTKKAFEVANALATNYVEAEHEEKIERVLKLLNTNKASHAYYVSLCLDVFSKAVAPGVNESSVLGLPAEIVFQGLRELAASGKVKAFDVLEYNPSIDVAEQTAQLGAVCIAEFLRFLVLEDDESAS